VEIEVNEPCHVCSGSGAAPGADLKTCGECGGAGTVSFGQGGFAVQRPCPRCLGRGVIPTQPCPSCGGNGAQRVRKKIVITVPQATDTGSRIRLKQQGGKGTNGGPPGDLIINFQVTPDPRDRRSPPG
jgi:molecular chaperone DnaJ